MTDEAKFQRLLTRIFETEYGVAIRNDATFYKRLLKAKKLSDLSDEDLQVINQITRELQ